MRGKGIYLTSASIARRITPAHAGKRMIPYQCAAIMWDHPRPCGEKCAYDFRVIRV